MQAMVTQLNLTDIYAIICLCSKIILMNKNQAKSIEKENS